MIDNGHSSEFKVGLFTALCIAVLVATAVVLGGNPFSSKKFSYFTDVENAAGIGERTQVRTAGVQVGQVTKIEILTKGARIHYDIKGEVKIPLESIVEVRSRGILGDMYLEIIRGPSLTEFYPTGSHIPRDSSGSDLGSLMSSMNSIAKDVKQVTTSLAKAFGGSEGEKSLVNIVKNIETITDDFKKLVQEQKKHVAEVIESVRRSALMVESLIAANESKVNDIVSSARLTAKNLEVFSQDLKILLSSENRAKVQNIIDEVDKAAAKLRMASGRLDTILANVENGEGTVGQLLTKDETADEIKETLKSIQDIVKPISHLQIKYDYRGELRVDNFKRNAADSFSNQFNVVFQTQPDRSYIVGLTDSPATRTVTKTTTTVENKDGKSESTEVKSIPQDHGRLRYNLQFAKRFDAVALRFGIFANYAGVAADVYSFNDKLIGSIEASQFSSRETYRLREQTEEGFVKVKAFANYYITPNLFITGGVDELVKSKSPKAFFGAGFTFGGDDLKAVAGAASLAK